MLWPGNCGQPWSQMVGVKVQGETVNMFLSVCRGPRTYLEKWMCTGWMIGLNLTNSKIFHQTKARHERRKRPRSTCLKDYRRVGPEGALAAVAAGSARRTGVLAEVVVARDGLSAEVTHEAAAAARHPVAALRLDQARPALDTLPHPGCRHSLLTAARGTWTELKNKAGKVKDKSRVTKRHNGCKNMLLVWWLQRITWTSRSMSQGLSLPCAV